MCIGGGGGGGVEEIGTGSATKHDVGKTFSVFHKPIGLFFIFMIEDNF